MRRRLPLFRVVVLLTVCLAVTAVSLLRLVRLDRVITARGQLIGGSAPIRALRTGTIGEVHVQTGDVVDAGQLLICLDTEALISEQRVHLARTRSLEDQQQALLAEQRRLQESQHPWELAQARRAVQRAELELSSAETRLRIQAELWTHELTTKLQLDEATLTRDLAQLALEETQREIPQLESRHESKLENLFADLQSLASQVEEEQAILDDIHRRIELSTVRAERQGTVIGESLHEQVRRSVEQGTELMRLVHGPVKRFEGVIQDSGRRLAKPELSAKVRLDAYPWLIHGTISGRVSTIAERPSVGGGYQVQVKLDLERTPGPVYEGMNGEARILIEEKVSLVRYLFEKIVGRDEL